MEPDKNLSEKLKGSVTELMDAYQDLLSVKATEHASLGISITIVGVVALTIAAFVLLFAGLGSAWWIGERIENMKIGFFIVGALYVVVLVILIASRKTVIPYLRNLLIRKMYEQQEQD